MFYTERLMLRAVEPEIDMNAWVQWFNDEEFLEAIKPKPPVTSSKTAVKKFVEELAARPKTMPFFIVCDKPTGDDHPSKLKHTDDVFVKDGKARYPYVGLLSIGSPDGMQPATRIARFGIAMDREHQNNGYGSEVLKWALFYCFKILGLHKVELSVQATNKRAIHVYEKLGFIREGVRREQTLMHGEWCDQIEYGILEKEWHASQAK